MVHFSRKKIKGRNYLYAIESFRLPNGRVAKLSKLIKNDSEAPGLAEYFEEKRAEALAKYAHEHFQPFILRDNDALLKIERMRVEYGKILRRLSKNQLKDLFDRFTANFTYESNALEGNSLTLKEVAIVLFENVSVKGEDLREIYETRNSREVVEGILRNKFKVSEESAMKMHSMLVKDMGVAIGYKKFPNYLHGRQVVTAAPEKVPSEMRDLLEWFSENLPKTHPVQLAARFHGKFERIHPFEDGNGRVGRFFINVILTNAGYPPLIIRKTQRISYLGALEDFDNGRPQKLENFLYERLKETHEKFFRVYAKYLK